MIEVLDVTKRYGPTIAVLGVLLVTSEYATSQIRATFGATPQRATVLAAKATSFTGVVVATGAAASFVALFTGQPIFASKGLEALIAYVAAALAVGGVLLTRRDA